MSYPSPCMPMENLIEQIKKEEHWFKKSKLILQFHNEHVKSNGDKRGNMWTITKTAKALDLSIGYTCEALVLAQSESLKGLSRSMALKVIRSRSRSNE